MSQTVPNVISDVSDTFVPLYLTVVPSLRVLDEYPTECEQIFTILVWDHIVTFSDEVEYIWKGKKGPIFYLFLFNRYFTPLGFIINFISVPQLDSGGCTVAIAVEVVGAMMAFRINALYPTRKWISGGLAVLLAIETGINVWLISHGEPVLHNKASGVHACSMVFDPAISHAASASAWYPLMYDSIVFALTVNRTLPSIRKKEAGFIVKKLLEDGLLYYSVIFSITFVLTFMIVGAPPGTKNICAQMEQLITVAMMSRITLSLKKAGRRGEIIPSPFLFDGRNPDFFSDTYLQSAVEDAPEDVPPPDPITGPKQPARLILHGPNTIQFAIPPSRQLSHMSDSFEIPTAHDSPNSLRRLSMLRSVTDSNV
ncbi:hypothetical protein DFH07DRAFT_961180 [Mycena maculata]|uniref:DUF6533 domain-containing protein n=1 Tax=Mycena maculata TaxID=230809 RepID=A0AAD7IWV3_9AGAR|nr:hypothetical protein DFH07DRAFT_961180 [Mycena maculata]